MAGFSQNHLGNHEAPESSPCALPVASPPTAVLFDWDNTLVDTWQTVFRAFNNTLVAFGRAPWPEEVAVANIQRSGREAFPKLFGDKAQEAQDLFYKLVEEGSLQGMAPMPGSENLLNVLAQKGIPLGIVSNKTGLVLRKEVTDLKWDHYFGVLVGAGDAAQDKPAADPIFRALETLRIPPSRHVWMVGDAPVDWHCAMTAGCQPIAIGNRFKDKPSTLVSIEDCAALEKIFAKM